MENYFGRMLTASEIESDVHYELQDGMREEGNFIICNRCESKHLKEEVALPIGAFYCPSCIELGRIRSDESLYYLPQKLFEPKKACVWQGRLTAYQAEISVRLVTAAKEKDHLLVHAVTGAGKTEMMYAAVDEVIKQGGAVAIASPRIDVVKELEGRLRRDFSCPIACLYGGSESYKRSPLVIATTHQLLRFREAFDLVIVDEVDAFPYVDNPMLYQAVRGAQKKEAAVVYLTATSTKALEREVSAKRLAKVSLARRFHGNPLVVPQFRWQSQFDASLCTQRKSGYPLLIFAPEIERGEALAECLSKTYPEEKIGFVSAQTADRLDIVEDFRTQSISILVTTTILERGVTFPKVDVFVNEAGHPNYTRSALIQIAGRAGRSPERPTGLVTFFHTGKTGAMVDAVREINNMNQKGGF